MSCYRPIRGNPGLRLEDPGLYTWPKTRWTNRNCKLTCQSPTATRGPPPRKPLPVAAAAPDIQAQALYDYEGSDANDLGVQSGQVVYVVQKTSADCKFLLHKHASRRKKQSSGEEDADRRQAYVEKTASGRE